MIKSLCCLNSDCIKTSCRPCTRCLGLTLNHEIKLAYFLIVGLMVAVSLILKTSIKDPSSYVLNKTGCEDAWMQYTIPII